MPKLQKAAYAFATKLSIVWPTMHRLFFSCTSKNDKQKTFKIILWSMMGYYGKSIEIVIYDPTVIRKF